MTRAGRAASVVAVVTGVVVVGLLHVLGPASDPVAHRLSEYAMGPYGWLMTAAFLLVGTGIGAFGLTLLSQRPRDAGNVALAVVAGAGALGMIVSGVYPTGVSPSVEQWHSIASTVGTVATTVLAVGWSLRSRRGALLAAAAAVLLLVSPALHDTPVTGLGQRVLWGALVTWLVQAAWVLPAAAGPGNERAAPEVGRADSVGAGGPSLGLRARQTRSTADG